MEFPKRIITSKDLPTKPEPNKIYTFNNKAAYIDRQLYIIKKIKIGTVNSTTNRPISNINGSRLDNVTSITKIKKGDILTLHTIEKAFFKLLFLPDGYWAPYGEKTTERTIHEETVTIDYVVGESKVGSGYYYLYLLTKEN